MSAGHTPGPWVFAIEPQRYPECDDADLDATVRDIDGNVVVYVPENYHIPGDYAANARLIAAAPELLEALVRLIPDDFDEHPDDFADDWHQARQAVARARGETPKGEK